MEGGLAWIEMNDPPANTYTYEMMQQLDSAILKARMDESAYVIMLRGAGEKFFSAGANIFLIVMAVNFYLFRTASTGLSDSLRIILSHDLAAPK